MAEIKKTVDKVKKTVQNAGKKMGKGGKTVAKKVGASISKGSKTAAKRTQNAVKVTEKKLIKALDQDGNGVVDSTDIILMAIKMPGVCIKRDSFLRKEFARHCSKEKIEEAIKTTPAQAGINSALIEKVANETIKYERNMVVGLSSVLGIPGGVAMVATIPADIAQYYGYMLRAAQKLMYLYGFPELKMTEDGINIDTETINSLTVCLGIMYGVANADIAIKAMARALATGVEKKLLKKALTKGAIYPIVKAVMKWFGVNLTKSIFAGFFKKSIPVIGGVISGTITYKMFGPCCNRLKKTLKDTSLSNLNHEADESEEKLFDSIRSGEIIDVEPEELLPVEDEAF